MMLLTPDELIAATGCSKERATLYLPFLQAAMKTYDITSPKRMAGFLSQISHESGRLERLEESLNYSVDALVRTFGRHRISIADAHKYGRSHEHKADQQAIANLIYGGTWGAKNLGNTEPGDGWRFRGRGLKQLTGRANYKRCGDALALDLIGSPDLLLKPINAAFSAAWFWDSNGLNKVADAGDVQAMTRIINGGAMGLAQRQALFDRGLEVFA